MKKLVVIILIGILSQACDKNDPAPATSNKSTPNGHVDNWIYDNMKYWYYWTNDITSKPDSTQDPEPFFKSLLSSEDRFSWIQDNFTDLINELRGVTKEPGFEFALYKESQTSNNVIAQVLYVKPNSPAESAGLKRGDIINQINGTQITTDNYSDLLDKLSENHSLTYKPLDVDSKTLGDSKTIDLVPVEYAEDPNYLNKVITNGDRKIGYYVYNLFSEGPDDSTKTYSTEMDNVFASFQSQSITDLILDLRFSSGGAESAAQNLASLIAPNVTSTTVFVSHQYNDQVTADIKADPNLGDSYLKIPFSAKTQNVGGLLREQRVYILTGKRTASASELIINGLKPFMDVYLIGDTTVGKNVGSVTLYNDNDPDNKWGMQPIVTKLFNNQGQSDYSGGFAPQIVDQDNSLYLYPLGDTRESLLSKAIQQITGGPQPARIAQAEKAGEVIYHSLDMKKRSGVTTIHLPF
jgi:C-terminal processing protease CtpA/Prc